MTVPGVPLVEGVGSGVPLGVGAVVGDGRFVGEGTTVGEQPGEAAAVAVGEQPGEVNGAVAEGEGVDDGDGVLTPQAVMSSAVKSTGPYDAANRFMPARRLPGWTGSGADCGMLGAMALRRFLGLPGDAPAAPARSAADAAETATVRRIVAELEALAPAERRYLAGFAYLLSRAALADLEVSADERRLIEQIVADIGGLPEAQAVLVVEIARHQGSLYGGTEDYLVTREFAAATSEEQRLAAMEACFAVVAADHSISAEEYAELTQIADELDLTREQLNVIRRDYREHLVAIQRMRAAQSGG